MHQLRHLVWVVGPLALAVLAACGQTPGTSCSSGELSVGTTGPITVAVANSSYVQQSTISVTVKNGGSETIYAPDHQTSCTIVTLQILQGTQWQPVRNCIISTVTRLIPLAPGQEIQAQLHPGPFQQSRWDVGTYRAAVIYSTRSDDLSPNNVVYSGEFVIC